MAHKLLKGMLSALNEKNAAGATILSKGAFRSEPSGFLSTGIEEVDRYILGCGGLPRGRVSEVYGDPGAGKSSFVYSCLTQCQKAGGIPVLIHTEEAAQKARLVDTFGVAPDEILLCEPDHMEGVVDSLQRVLNPVLKSRAKDKPPILIAWDSLAATRVKDHDVAASSEGPAARARLLNAALRVLPRIVAETQAHLMIVNQNREKIGVVFGSPKTQPGGKAPKYHSTFRLELTYTGKVGKTSHPTGIEVQFHATKNKMAPPYRKCKARLDFAAGWTDWGVAALAKELGLVGKSASVRQAREALDARGWDPNRKEDLPGLDGAPEPGEAWDEDAE